MREKKRNVKRCEKDSNRRTWGPHTDFVNPKITASCQQPVTLNEVQGVYEPEPFVGSTDQTGKVPFNVLDVVELGSKRIGDVDDDDLPVGLAFVEEGHDTENLDLLDLTDVADSLTDLADIERIVVALGLGFGVLNCWVFPGLSSEGERTCVDMD